MEEKNSKIDFIIFPFLWLFKTQQGNRLMDRLAQYRIVSFLSYFSLILMPIFSIIAILVLLLTVSLYLSFSEVREIARDVGPQGALLIPGLNPYLPIVYGWIAIFIGIVIHELSHGVVARNLDIPVKSAGLMFFVLLPIGAFVEVDDEKMDSISFKKSGRIIAAGSGSNILVAFLSLLLLVGVVNTMQPVAQGIAVGQIFVDSPAHEAGILPGDIITHLNQVPTPDSDVFSSNFDNFDPGEEIVLTVQRQHQQYDFELILSTHPDNQDLPFIGVVRPPVDINTSLEMYQSGLGLSTNFLLYLSFPTSSSFSIPFSDSMQKFYTSSLGDQYIVLSNLFFWIWFINFNLGIFNALPLGPLDGGQAFKRGLKSFTKNKLSEYQISLIARFVTLSIVSLLLMMFLLPYLL
jgi:membrane-associated protease RseP (regulator of RpoE activity)|tara:strand:- start:919 stop:2136 length:1218 start_codon:yes stop_codon:yes gene_type:complete